MRQPVHASHRSPLPSFAGAADVLARQSDRQRRWRALYPELAARFFTPEGHPRCLFCDRAGPPDDPFAPFRSVTPAPSDNGKGKIVVFGVVLWSTPKSAIRRRIALYGPERLWSCAIATECAEEVWCWRCVECPGPDTPEGVAAIDAAIERRAAGAKGWHSTAAPGAD